MTTLDQLRALMIPEVRELFFESMQTIVDRAQINEMIAAIENNDFDALVQASGFTPAALNQLVQGIERAYERSGEVTVEGWPNRVRTPFGTVIPMFNARNPRVEDDIRTRSSEFITRTSEQIRQNIRTTLQAGVVNGDNPRTTALNIVGRVDPATKKRVGGSIGLATNQLVWVESARTHLQQLNPQYLKSALRDKRFDKIVSNAIESKTPLSPAIIDRLTTAYKMNALRYRGENIARTETISSINRGEYMAHKDAIDQRLVTADAISKEWDDVKDTRERNSHIDLGNRYGSGKGIDLDEGFTTLEGTQLLHPGDKSLGAGAKDVTSCRCKAKYVIDFTKGLT